MAKKCQQPGFLNPIEKAKKIYLTDIDEENGGLIQVADELNGYNKDRAFKNASLIYNIVTQIFAISKEQNIPTYKAADVLVANRIDKIGR